MTRISGMSSITEAFERQRHKRGEQKTVNNQRYRPYGNALRLELCSQQSVPQAALPLKHPALQVNPAAGSKCCCNIKRVRLIFCCCRCRLLCCVCTAAAGNKELARKQDLHTHKASCCLPDPVHTHAGLQLALHNATCFSASRKYVHTQGARTQHT
jgi:hypothetical protein